MVSMVTGGRLVVNNVRTPGFGAAMTCPRQKSVFRLDGRGDPGRIVAALGDPARDTVAMAEAAPSRAAPAGLALLERDVELDLLADLIRDVAAGRGRLLLFEAPAGLGKSSLLDHGSVMAREAGLRVLRARGHQLEQAYAWGAARALFEGLVLGLSRHQRAILLEGPAAPAHRIFDDTGEPERAEATDGGFAILHALYWLAARLAEHQPLLLVVDDAHWVDEPSLRFLAYVLGRVSDAPVGIVAAARSRESGAAGLVDLLVGDPGARVHGLHPFGAAAVRELVRQRFTEADDQLCRRCFELTAGNPLQLRELLAGLAGRPRPLDAAGLAAGTAAAARSLERSVRRRLAAMTSSARALAEAVAVLEDDVPLHLAAALAGLEADAAVAGADELVGGDVLRRGDPLGFIHPLLRAAVYGSLSERARTQMHGRAARLLAAAGATGEQICGHLLEAPPMGDEGVVETLRGTARRALAHGVPASAVAYLERASREPPPAGGQADVLAELGRAEAIIGRPESLSHLQAAITLVGDVRDRARLLLEFGRALHHSGRLTDACAAFRRGLDELELTDADNDELRVELEGGYLNAALFAPDRAADAHVRAHDIMRRADRLTSHAELALLSKAMMMQLWEGRPRDVVLGAAHRLLREGRLSEDDAAGSQTVWHVIATLGWCDDYTAAHDALRMAQADSRRRGSVLAYALACVFRSRHGLWTGQIGDAVHDARAALDILPAESVYVCSAAYCLACGLLEEGLGDQAEAALKSADQQQPAAPPFFTAWREMAHGRLAAHRGEDEYALRAFLAAGEHHAELRIVNPAVLPWRSEAGLAAHRLHRPDLARALIDEELALAETFGGPRAIGVARRAAGLLAHGDVAVDLLRQATEALAACGALVEKARAMTDLGAAIRRDGRPAEARPILRDAVRLAEEVGASVVGQLARAELRVAGGRAPTRPSRPTDPLTPSERRIAELAAAGRGNRQIADALFITVKAVEWHLGNTYRKLGISGRAELTGLLDKVVDASG